LQGACAAEQTELRDWRGRGALIICFAFRGSRRRVAISTASAALLAGKSAYGRTLTDRLA